MRIRYGLGIYSNRGACSSNWHTLVTNKSSGETVPGWTKLRLRNQKVWAVQSIDYRECCWYSTPTSPSSCKCWLLIAHSCSSRQWNALNLWELPCPGGYTHSSEWFATKGWLSGVQGAGPWHGDGSYSVLLFMFQSSLLDEAEAGTFLLWFVLPLFFQELCYNKAFTQESLLLGNSKQGTCSYKNVNATENCKSSIVLPYSVYHWWFYSLPCLFKH